MLQELSGSRCVHRWHSVLSDRHSIFFVTVDVSYEQAPKMSRIIDLDVDIGADAVDYKYVLLLNSYSKSTS